MICASSVNLAESETETNSDRFDDDNESNHLPASIVVRKMRGEEKASPERASALIIISLSFPYMYAVLLLNIGFLMISSEHTSR